MLTPDDLRAMTVEERAQLFAQLTERHYPKGVQVGMARDFDVHYKTVAGWQAEPQRIPWAVLMVLSHWTGDPEAREARNLEHIKGVSTGLAALAKGLAQLSKELR
jgi:hypothetical protein